MIPYMIFQLYDSPKPFHRTHVLTCESGSFPRVGCAVLPYQVIDAGQDSKVTTVPRQPVPTKWGGIGGHEILDTADSAACCVAEL